MTYPWLLALSLAKLLAAFLVVFVYLPRRIFPQRPAATSIERFFENLCLMTFFSVVAAHTLAMLRIHSAFSLAVSYALLALAVRWYRDRRALLPGLKRSLVAFNISVLRAADGLVDLPRLLGRRISEGARQSAQALSSGPARVHAAAFAGVLGAAAWLRSADVFRFAPLSFSDSYYHLEAIKRLEGGEPYWQDIYPKGFHAFMSVLHLSTGLDPVLVVKLVGPLIGVLIVLSVYHAAFRLTGSKNAALVAMLLVGIVDGHSSLLFERVGSDGWAQFFGSTTAAPFMQNFRQTAALAQEFALVFLLPAILFTHAYWAGAGTRRDLALSFTAVTIVLMSHWIVAAALAAGLILVSTLSLLRPGLTAKTVMRGMAACAVAAFIGNLQLIGYATETRAAHASTPRSEYAQALPDYYASWLDRWSEIPAPAPVLYASAVVAVAVGLCGLIAVRGAAGKILWGWIALFMLALVLETRASSFGLRYLIPPDRTGEFMGVVLAVAGGAIWSMVSRLVGERGPAPRSVLLSQAVTAVALSGILVLAAPAGFDAAPRYEYGSLAELYYHISREYPPLQWTIVSNVEDYSKVLTRGWHLNAADFLARFDPYEERLALPSPDVFIFVEKTPLSVATSYQKQSARRDEQRRLGEWVNARSARFNDLALYHEDETVLVYRWRQP